MTRYEADPETHLLVVLGEVGGVEEYELAAAVRDGTVTLALSTEKAGGITEKDLDLAEQIDFATSFGG